MGNDKLDKEIYDLSGALVLGFSLLQA